MPRILALGRILIVLAVLARARGAPSGVTLREDAATYTLDNGIVTAMVAKDSGDLVSLKYQGREVLGTLTGSDGRPDLQRDPPGDNPNGLNRGMTDHQYGFWSHDAMGVRGTEPAIASVTIDPQANGGERAEVSVKGTSHGRKMGTGPGARHGEFVSDIEIRYALGRGDSGVYTYCTFEHPAEYASTTLGEARFGLKLSNSFDWMMIDQHHHMPYPPELERNGDDKYNYTSVQFEHPAFGWVSSANQIGCFIVNPTVEYLSGGPTKVEFMCHRDTNRVTAPCVLNYWRSSHYGGSSVDVAQGEHWTKVIGPFLIYVNSNGDPDTLWKDAIAQVGRENQKWPYGWVNGVDYPHRAERGSVSGQLVLNDPLMPTARMSKLRVGLTFPDYHVTTGRHAAGNTPADITWMTDAKHYEFWVYGDDDGHFSIPMVRPGKYTLHAIADGVLGEFARTDITVAGGQAIDLGQLPWTPVRRGRQLWDIGIPNRNASEFFKGDDYFHDGMGLVYAQLFPHDDHYVIGQSDYRKDWYFQHVPHSPDPDAEIAAVAARRAARLSAMAANPAPAGPPPAVAPPGAPGTGPGRGMRRGPPPAMGRPCTWSVTFDQPTAPHGRATLRVAIAGGSASGIEVAVNGQPVGTIPISGDSTVGRNGIQGLWYEREVPFDASLMKAGANVLTLTVPAGGLTNGIVYDYLRLELDESAPAPAAVAGL
jgi:rhamnogalacturonan endolyase